MSHAPGRIDPLAAAFAGATEAYEQGRPEYPPEAIGWAAAELGLDAGSTVVDLAAGTGKLSRQLVGRVGRVIAVEPLAEMRAALAAAVPSAELVAGTAERIPLADATADAVTVGAAFHWFNGDDALAEIHRVLRPGGGLALFWNPVEVEGQPWSPALGKLLDDIDRPGVSPQNRPHTGIWREAFGRSGLFAPLQRRSFDQRAEFDLDRLLLLVSSWSWVAAMSAAGRERLLADVADALRPYAADGFEVGLRTDVDVTRRL